MSDACSPRNGQALVRENKTFLEFRFFPYDTSDRFRRGSAPSCIARCDADVMWRPRSIAQDDSDQVLWTSEDIESDFDAEDSAIAEDQFDCWNCRIGLEETSPDGYCNTHSNVTRQLGTNLLELGSALVRTKNTFLEFSFARDDLLAARDRSNSSPACFGSQGADEDMWNKHASAMESYDEVIQTAEDLMPLSHVEESLQTSENALDVQSWDTDAEEHMPTPEENCNSVNKAKRDRIRPCKGKRHRHKKLLMRLCKQVDEDPEGFNIALIQWPQSLIDNCTLREQLLPILNDHIAHALKEVATKRDVCK